MDLKYFLAGFFCSPPPIDPKWKCLKVSNRILNIQLLISKRRNFVQFLLLRMNMKTPLDIKRILKALYEEIFRALIPVK